MLNRKFSSGGKAMMVLLALAVVGIGAIQAEEKKNEVFEKSYPFVNLSSSDVSRLAMEICAADPECKTGVKENSISVLANGKKQQEFFDKLKALDKPKPTYNLTVFVLEEAASSEIEQSTWPKEVATAFKDLLAVVGKKNFKLRDSAKIRMNHDLEFRLAGPMTIFLRTQSDRNEPGKISVTDFAVMEEKEKKSGLILKTSFHLTVGKAMVVGTSRGIDGMPLVFLILAESEETAAPAR